MESRIDLYSSIIITVNQYFLLSSITLSRSGFEGRDSLFSHDEIVLPFGRLANSCSLDLSPRPLSSCSSTRTYCSRYARCGPGLFRENTFRRKAKCFTSAKLSVRTTVDRQKLRAVNHQSFVESMRVLCVLTWRRASRHKGGQFSCLIWPDGIVPSTLATRLSDPPDPQFIGKT